MYAFISRGEFPRSIPLGSRCSGIVNLAT
ncbi:MAG: hypothetical protein ACRCYD_09795 [Plesiomonas sp.]